MLPDGLQRLRVEPRARSPRSIHAHAWPPGASAIDRRDDGLGETRGGPGQCHPSSGSTRPGCLSLPNNASGGIDARARWRRYTRTH